MTDPKAKGAEAGEVLDTFADPTGPRTVHVIADPKTPSGLNYVLSDGNGNIVVRPETETAQELTADGLDTDADPGGGSA
jgi:hypothetical protein